MPDLTLYTNPMSRGRIARWMLEEVGEPYETVLLEYGEGMKSAEFLAINPMGKVPAIRHGDSVITEAAAICAYLADAFPKKGLAPPLGDPRRGPYFRWMFFAAGPAEQAITGKSYGLLAPEDKKMNVGYGSYDDTMAALEGAVARGPHVCGDQFTAADVYVGSHIVWGLGFKSIPSCPVFEAYAERMRARPAYQSANELDDAAMAKMEVRPG